MREIQEFDPSVGGGTIDTYGVNKNEQLMCYNDSIYRLRLYFNDRSIGVVPPLWNKDYIQTNMPLGKIKWEVIDSLNIANNPSSMFYGEVYEPGEHVASVNASMQRSVVSSIPGGVSATVTTLKNTTDPDGTNIITIADSLGNTFTLDNNGLLTLFVKVSTALIQMIKTNATDPMLQLGLATHLIEVLGDLTIDGTLTATSANSVVTSANKLNSGINLPGGGLGRVASSDIIATTTAAPSRVDTHILAGNTPGSASAIWNEVEGVQVSTHNINAAIQCKNNKPIVFNFGSLGSIGIKAFTGIISGIQTLTHNFGFIPTGAYFCCGQIANTNPGTATNCVYNCGTVSCTLNIAAAVNGFLLYLG